MWISLPRLISASVFDPTEILHLNFRGRFVSIQVGQLDCMCLYTCVCRQLCASTLLLYFFSVPPSTTMNSYLLQMVSCEY